MAVNAVAQGAGLQSGLTLKAARARLPQFATTPHDGAADERVLEAVGRLCRRYTPAVAMTPPVSIRLNLTGCGPLFGGEDRLVAELLERLEALGLEVRHGLADTPGLALALCGWGETPAAGPGEREAVLAPLAVAALRLEAADEAALHALGLRRIRQLLERPFGELSQAFEERVSLRLDQVLGRRPEPLPLTLEPPVFVAERRLFDPIALEAQVMGLTRRLADDLCEQMARNGVGVRSAALDLFRVDGKVKRLSVRTARPLRDPADLTRLFESRLADVNEGLEADFGFDLLRLMALRTELLQVQTADLLGEGDPQARFAAFAESVQARLGIQSVLMAVREPSTQKPEREWRLRPLTRLTSSRKVQDEVPEAPAAFEGAPLVPLRLFRPPQPIDVIAAVPEDPPAKFVWRRLTHVVAKAEGPQRLSPEWSREGEVARTRDYYRVEDEQGLRFWLFREGLYGVDATSTRQPRWFLHGLFA
ncbi:DNA polymerase Y family protein [soil metagenome]